jgi:cyanophycin synthetase
VLNKFTDTPQLMRDSTKLAIRSNCHVSKRSAEKPMSESTNNIERESEYFDDSRRLTGPNLFFASTGAVLEAFGVAAKDAAVHARWRVHVVKLTNALGWGEVTAVVRVHNASTSLALSAPIDQLFTATEVNEWAWETASFDEHPTLNISNAIGDTPNDVGNFDQALLRLQQRCDAERNDALRALQAAAHSHGVECYVDDELASVGSGAGSKTIALEDGEALKVVDWRGVSEVPIALVTGSNGKTTTVRLIAAMAKAAGLAPGYSSTEGVFIANVAVTQGDYSGPAGARLVLRDTRVTCAVLESARGGMLRRGLAVRRANVAVVTNVSADHFGEYGIDNLDDLADAKLIVSRALGENGVIVLNGDDPILMRRSSHLWPKIAVFASDYQSPLLQQKRREGGMTCGVEGWRLILSIADATHDLGSIADMPLTANASATYNIANIAAAVLAATVIGVAPAIIAARLATFGHARQDNPGRLERWNIGGVTVLIDYAHNPAGLTGLIDVANQIRAAHGRLGLLLGQAGNRENVDIEALAKAAARYQPDLIVLKDIEGFLRGREAGEIPAMIEKTLISEGVKRANIKTELSEFAAAKVLVEWARASDVIVLPMHGTAARQAMREWLDARLSATLI